MARNRQSTVKQLQPPKQQVIFMTVGENGNCTGIYESVADACAGTWAGERLFAYELSLECKPRPMKPAVVATDGTVFEDFDEPEGE